MHLGLRLFPVLVDSASGAIYQCVAGVFVRIRTTEVPIGRHWRTQGPYCGTRRQGDSRHIDVSAPSFPDVLRHPRYSTRLASHLLEEIRSPEAIGLVADLAVTLSQFISLLLVVALLQASTPLAIPSTTHYSIPQHPKEQPQLFPTNNWELSDLKTSPRASAGFCVVSA